LLPASQAELERVSDALKVYAGTVEIQGYTSSTGSQEYNLKLSRLRAEAVKNFLISKGVPASKMTTVGYGDRNPIASNDTPAGRALNRRIEIVLK
ncbi:MAG: OmpA family protein, partial [Bacteroidia bacterium]|nr:OmpA family protein [Bacteroidia bacterium]